MPTERVIRFYEVPDGVSTLTICWDCKNGLGATSACENCRLARAYIRHFHERQAQRMPRAEHN